MGIRVIVDLRSEFGEIRDQNPRPTCMAFAASDAHAFARSNTEALSVEYAFFHAVQRKSNPDPTKGVSFKVMSETLSIDGQPLESGWPYQNRHVVSRTWKPPKNLGTIYRRKSKPVARAIPTLYAQLDGGKPVIVVTDISESFFRARATTEVLSALATEPRLNTHAVIAVGYGEKASVRCILIRNSWGKKWFDGGYGWIDQQYLASRIRCLGIMD